MSSTYMRNDIAIIGAGAWGTAIGVQLCKNNDRVFAYTIDKEICEQINRFHIHPALGEIQLPNNLVATTNLDDLASLNYLIIAVPSDSLLGLFDELQKSFIDKNSKIQLIIATKGLSTEGELWSKVLLEKYGVDCSFLAGPNLAKEVAANVMSKALIASKNYSDANKIAAMLSSDTFHVLASKALIEIQISGAIKNVAAIIGGILKGLNYGANSRAWIFTVALKCVYTIAQTIKNAQSTCTSQEFDTGNILNVGVIGDMALCFFFKGSRNNEFGRMLSVTSPKQRKDLIESHPKLLEGVRNCHTLISLLQKYKIKCEVVATLSHILDDPENLERYVEELFMAARFD